MLAFKYMDNNISIQKLLEIGNKISKCGATVFFNGDPFYFNAIIQNDEIGIVHCIEAALSKDEQTIIEHAMQEWYHEFNFALDRLSEEGHHKESKETQQLADRIALGVIIGWEFVKIFEKPITLISDEIGVI